MVIWRTSPKILEAKTKRESFDPLFRSDLFSTLPITIKDYTGLAFIMQDGLKNRGEAFSFFVSIDMLRHRREIIDNHSIIFSK